jgi:hypothetical protein
MRAWSAPAGTPWRRLAIVVANPRGAIYGTIVASSMIAATSAGGKSPDLILTTTVATLLVFWLAHVYAHFLDHEVRHDRTRWKVLASIMGQELSMVAAPALPILLLLLGAIGLLNERLAVQLALWTGVVQLFGWGIEVGRRRGRAWPAALLAGLINGSFGLVVIVLEVLLHH